MQFAVPSKGRAGSCRTQDVLATCVFYVPENEADAYRRCYKKNKIVSVPAEIKGITATRNWILDNTTDKRIVMVDDDVRNQGFVKLYASKVKHRKMNESGWIALCERLFDITEDMGWKVWGVSTQSAARSVYPFKPILTRSYITASFMGIVNDGTYIFDESFPVKEDYEIGLRHVRDYGGVLCFRGAYWENSHWGDEGGCKDYRTGTMETKCIKQLIKMYPGQIRRVTRGGSGYSIDLEF